MDLISCLLAARFCVLFRLSKISSKQRRGWRRDGVRLKIGGGLPCTIASLTACFSVRPLKMSFSIYKHFNFFFLRFSPFASFYT